MLSSLNSERGRVAGDLPCEFKEGIEKTDWIRGKIEDLLFGGKTISPTFVDEYLNCPYMFYLKRIANIKEKAHLEESQRADRIGSLVHHLLEKGFARHKGEFINNKILESVKKKVIFEAKNFIEKGRFREFDIGEMEDVFKYIKNLEPIKKEMLEKVIQFRLEALFEFFFKDLEKNEKVKLIDVEKGMTVDDFKFNDRNIKLYGQIDRIERLEGKEIVRIIDFKTGSYAKLPPYTKFFKLMEKDIEELSQCVEVLKKSINSIQLPFYIYLYLKNRMDKGISQIHSFLYLIGSSGAQGIDRGFKIKNGNDGKDGFDDFIEGFELILSAIFKNMLETSFIVATPVDVCNYCNYSHFCSFRKN